MSKGPVQVRSLLCADNSSQIYDNTHILLLITPFEKRHSLFPRTVKIIMCIAFREREAVSL